MAANKLPFFRFDPADYLNDPAVVQMDADAEGCYIRLLARSWQSPTPGIIFVGHVREMAAGHRLTEQYRLLYDEGSGVVPEESPEAYANRRWEHVHAQLAEAFDTESSPDHWLQRRMISEHKYANGIAEAQRRGALMTNAATGRSPRSKRTLSARRALGKRTPSAGEVDVEVDGKKNLPSPPSPTLPRIDPESLTLPSWLPLATWADWCAHRRSFGKRAPWTVRAAELCIATLERLRSAGDEPRAVIERSIVNGWRGLFALDQERNPQPETDVHESLREAERRGQREAAQDEIDRRRTRNGSPSPLDLRLPRLQAALKPAPDS